MRTGIWIPELRKMPGGHGPVCNYSLSSQRRIPCASWPANLGTSGLIERPASVTKVGRTCAHYTQTPMKMEKETV